MNPLLQPIIIILSPKSLTPLPGSSCQQVFSVHQHLQSFKSLAEICTRSGGRPDHPPVHGYWLHKDRYSLGSFILRYSPGLFLFPGFRREVETRREQIHWSNTFFIFNQQLPSPLPVPTYIPSGVSKFQSSMYDGIPTMSLELSRNLQAASVTY